MVKLTADDFIQKHTFVEVSTDNLHDDGLSKGDFIYVVNMQALPVSEEDVYLQKLHIIGHRYEGKGRIDTTKILVVNPDNLKKIGKKLNRIMITKFEKSYIQQANESSD